MTPTLDEFAETHTLRKLERYQGELFVLNIKGYYNPFKGHATAIAYLLLAH